MTTLSRQKVSLNLGHTSPEVEAFRNLFSRWNKNQIKCFSTLISPNSWFSNLISQVGTEANGDEGTACQSNTTGNVSELESKSNNQVVQMAVGRMFRQLLGAVPVFLLLKQHLPSRLEASSLITSQLFSAFVGSGKSGMDATLSNQLSDTTKKLIDRVAPELNDPILTKILGATGAAVALQPLTTIISKLATDPLPKVLRDIFSGNIQPMAGVMSSVKRSVAFWGMYEGLISQGVDNGNALFVASSLTMPEMVKGLLESNTGKKMTYRGLLDYVKTKPSAAGLVGMIMANWVASNVSAKIPDFLNTISRVVDSNNTDNLLVESHADDFKTIFGSQFNLDETVHGFPAK